MKKIIALFVVMLAFGLNANAQQKKAPATTAQPTQADEAIQKASARDMVLLTETVDLTEEQKGMFKGLFQTKYRTLADQSLTAERKESLAVNIERKLKSVMTPDQIAKLDSNPEVLKKLTH